MNFSFKSDIECPKNQVVPISFALSQGVSDFVLFCPSYLRSGFTFSMGNVEVVTTDLEIQVEKIE